VPDATWFAAKKAERPRHHKSVSRLPRPEFRQNLRRGFLDQIMFLASANSLVADRPIIWFSGKP
jgi:hypothetical protein